MTAKKPALIKGLARLPFKIPKGAEIKVQEGDTVERGTTLATRSGSEVVYDVMAGLGLQEGKGAYRLKKGAGDVVKVGEVLAERSGWFKLKKVVSQVAGTVSEAAEGLMKIRLNDEETKLLSPAAGKVTQLTDELVELEIPTWDLEARLGWGGFAWGEIKVLGDIKMVAGLEDLKGNLDDKVVALGGVMQKGFWYKAGTLGVNGLICAQVPDGFAEWWENQVRPENDKIAVLVMGDEEGNMSSEIWDWLTKMSGKMVFLDGASKKLMVSG